MYEMDFTGFTRTPESLERVASDNSYRRRLNWTRVCKSVKYRRGFRSFVSCFMDWVFNRNHF